MNKLTHTYGYFSITLSRDDAALLLHSNSERAFIVAQLQYFLSPRLILGDIPAYRQLASCIDLLAFSITPSSVQLVVFSIDASIGRHLGQCITERLAAYQSTHGKHVVKKGPPTLRTTLRALSGPHEALAKSISLHLNHDDWEYDRYSSIGFYLHDRRGDWMRLWRLTRLYENNADNYRSLLHEQLYLYAQAQSTMLDAQYLGQ